MKSKKVSNKKPRILYYDILRIIALLGVIMIHVSAENWYVLNLDGKWQANNFMNQIGGMFSVPLFISISGALLLKNNNFNIKTMITKYIPRILCCLICWHFIYYFYQSHPFTIQEIVNCFKGLLTGNTYSHLWYLYLVIGLYILTPILKKLVDNLNKKEFTYLLTIGFITIFLIPTINSVFKVDLNQYIVPYKVLEFNLYLFYYLLGYYLDKYQIKYCEILFAIGLVLGIVLSLYGNYLSIEANTKITMVGYNSIATILITISSFSLVKKYFINKNCKLINEIGNLTMGAYLIHFIIEKELLKFGFQSNMINTYIGSIVVTLVIAILSYCASFIISKIPLLNKVSS